MLKGWRTILFNVGVAAGTVALKSLAGIDWVSVVGPVWSPLVLAGANIALRYVTTTPVGQK